MKATRDHKSIGGKHVISVKRDGQDSGDDIHPVQLRDIPAIARRLGVCDKTVRRLIARGQLRAYRIGRQLRISDQECMRYLELIGK
jgi:excisionase family DNA binding protein